MLRLKRLLVFGLLAVAVIAGFSFWAVGRSGEGIRTAVAAPPSAVAKLEGADITTAVNVTPSPDAQWLTGAAARTGIPARALRAYVAAAVTANATTPGCGIGWNTIAAIGFVETAHGSYGGGSLNAAGQVSGPIVGPSLNGDGFAAIPDTDGGALDGDPHWDHAVGPMRVHPPPGGWRAGTAAATASPIPSTSTTPPLAPPTTFAATAGTSPPRAAGPTPSTPITSPTPTSATSRLGQPSTQRRPPPRAERPAKAAHRTALRPRPGRPRLRRP